jgi:hypothetical protein
MDRGATAKIGGMDRQILRDWVHRFNASGPQGLVHNWTEGPKPRLSAEQLAQLAQIPDREKDGVVRLGSTSNASSPSGSGLTSMSAMSGSFCRNSASPTSARGRAIRLRTSGSSRISKNFPRALKAHLEGLPETTPIEIWFEDEARIGQVRQWARNAARAARRSAL